MEELLNKNIIKFENSSIHFIIDNNDNIYFNGKDVASALGYANKKKAIIDHVDNDDKIKLEDINISIDVDKHPHSMYRQKSYENMIFSAD